MTHHRVFRILPGLLGIAAASAAHAQVTAFRISDMDLRDPHVYVNLGLGCNDVTDYAFGNSVNDNLQKAIQEDTNPADGYLDLSYLFQFAPLDQSQAANALTFGSAQCTAPMAGTLCRPDPGGIAASAALSDSTTCLEPLAGTVYGYTPAITSTPAPCFGASFGTVQVDLGGVPMQLHDTQIAASFDTAPATQLTNGLVRGFLTQADADATVIPASVALIGGQTLSSLLPGGSGNCASHSDMDTDAAVNGWWVYLNFVAARVALDTVFANGFE